ncbi:MAG TPA: hypothetical protein VIW27_10500 [Gammaproteobacteria bacterium]|jgi:hypothetical protein
MKPALIAMLLAAAGPALPASDSPYEGQQLRQIKSLSDAEIDGLLRGEGMGFARAAELNHYPGPAHVLELAAELQLSEQQLAQTRAIHERMNATARRLGAQLVDGEKALDELFAQATITPQSLTRQLSIIGDIRARLRGVHLQAHLEQRALLTQHQVHRYDALRGYLDGGSGHAHTHGGHN